MTDHLKHPLMQCFAYAHLPRHLQSASIPFAAAAETLYLAPLLDHLATLPDNDERFFAMRKVQEAQQILKNAVDLGAVEKGDLSAALRLLIEAKDCAVRSLVFKEPKPA